MNLSSLPKNIPELRKLIVIYSQQIESQTGQITAKDEQIETQTEQITAKDEQIETQTGQIVTQDKKITVLEEEVKLLRKLRFAHKSEKWTNQDNKQSLLFNEAELTLESPKQDDSEKTITITYTRKKAGRKKLDPNLLRKEIMHDLSDPEKICKCGCRMQEIGRDHREELDMQPAKYWVNHHIYPQYACTSCENISDESIPEVKSAPKDAIIPKSFASPGLLAQLCVSKFEDHLPFYRQERILKRLGVDLPRATMCNWMIQLEEKVQPILTCMHKDMLGSDLIMADETRLQVMKEPGRKNTTKSFMWIFRGKIKESSILLYQYHPTRSGKVASDFLKGYKGHLITDGYIGYSEVGSRADIIHAGCWAHVRRKFKDAHDATVTKNTTRALSLIQSLYEIEKKIRIEELSLEKTLSLRREKSALITLEFKQFLDDLNPLPESLLGKAHKYALNQWDHLLVFLDAPHVPIDNNRIENDIRPFVLGRKNWLFSGSPRGAHASCAIYSLIQTARANGLDPYLYLRYLFEKLITAKGDEILELAPHRIAPEVLEQYARKMA